MDYSRKYYTVDIPYLINNFIYEYDISKANLNVLFYKGVINKHQYNEIIQFGKGQREIYFGNLIKRDPKIGDILAEGLTEMRQNFIETNLYSDNEILSVKNDAIFVIGKPPVFTKFGNVEFVQKNVYTSYFNINKLEIYYYFNSIYNTEVIDIKGIDDNKLELHRDYMISLLCDVFNALQTGDTHEILSIIHNYYDKYVKKQLPIGYYRELNSSSLFRFTCQNGNTFLSEVPPDMNNPEYVKILNIMNNLNILRELHAIVCNIKS